MPNQGITLLSLSNKPAALAIGLLSLALIAGLVTLIQLSQPTVPMIALADIDDLDGELRNLHDLNDRPMVVNLWATWCPPCRREMPVLANAQQHRPDIQFVFVNQGESDRTVLDYLKEDQLQLQNVLLDPMSTSSRLLHTRVMPTTYFFDTNGSLVNTHLGELSTSTLDRLLSGLVTKP